MGIIFTIVIIITLYLLITDPFNLKSFLPQGVSPISIIKTVTGNNTVSIDNIDKNPLLTEQQEAQLESFGIDPATLPTSITPEMKKCFETTLSEKRVNEIIAGDQPTVTDLLGARSCIDS